MGEAPRVRYGEGVLRVPAERRPRHDRHPVGGVVQLCRAGVALAATGLEDAVSGVPPPPGLPVGFQNSVTGLDLGFYAARSYWLMRPPRTGRRLIRSLERSATGWSDRGGWSWQLRWGRRPL